MHTTSRTAAALAAVLALVACAAPEPATCKPPEAIHLMIDPDPDTGQPVVPRWVAEQRDGVDFSCPPGGRRRQP